MRASRQPSTVSGPWGQWAVVIAIVAAVAMPSIAKALKVRT